MSKISLRNKQFGEIWCLGVIVALFFATNAPKLQNTPKSTKNSKTSKSYLIVV